MPIAIRPTAPRSDCRVASATVPATEAARPRSWGDALRRRVAGGLHEATESGDEQRSWEQPEKHPEGNPAGEQRARPAAVELAGLERRVDECASVTQLVDAPGRLVASSNCAPAGRP
jgi:hypothetical protein